MSRQRITAIVLVAAGVIAGVVIFAAGGDGGDGRKASIGAGATGLSISNPRETEGNSGTKAVAFTITRSGTINVNSSVTWDTENGTAAGDDYTAAYSTVYFASNETTKTVVVNVKGDTADEDDETFKVVLSDPTRASILEGKGTGTATIVDDDGGTVASPSDLIANGGFEGTPSPWLLSGGAVRRGTGPAHGGTGSVELGGSSEYAGAGAWQVVTIPASASTATLTFWLNITTAETKTTVADELSLQLRDPSGTPFTGTLATYSNLDKTSAGTYTQRSFDLLRYKGKSFRVFFQTNRDTSLPTTFRIDDVSLK
jgi:hypothetical protein